MMLKRVQNTMLVSHYIICHPGRVNVILVIHSARGGTSGAKETHPNITEENEVTAYKH